MNPFALLPYRIFIQLMLLGMRVMSQLGHRKARRAWRERKGWHDRLGSANQAARDKGRIGPWFHMHCASLGEFEQGAPVLRLWRERNPDTPILLTFFSPSGMEAAPPEEADHVEYLPWDTAAAMRRFAGTLDIADTVLVKYEIWPEMIRALRRRGTRIHMIAARFDEGRHPLGWHGAFIRSHIARLTEVQVQDKASADAVAHLNWNVQVTGDPRVDQVLHTVEAQPSDRVRARLQQIEAWKAERKLLIVGSAWPPEWEALCDILPLASGWVALWFPHEVRGTYVDGWADHLGSARLAVEAGGEPELHPESPDMLVVDEVGILKYAYRSADLAVVGGGWGQGVHNILEPAAFGLPILCGPKVAGFREIEALDKRGAVRVCGEKGDLRRACLDWMQHDAARMEAGASAVEWVTTHRGAASRIFGVIDALRSGD